MLDERRSEYPISVVIPVRNGAHVIGRCLQAFVEIARAGQDFEVIVADNGSKDRTQAVVTTFAEKLNLQMLSVPGVPVSAVRNAGAAHARGTLLAFVDADCIVGKNWIQLAIAYPWGERSGAIGSFFSAGSDATWVARVWSRFEDSARFGAVELLPAGNMIIPRGAFEAAGGFDEALVSNEDVEFCYSLRTLGLRIEAVPELRAVHLGAPQTIRELYRREVWHGRDVLAVFLQHGVNARAVAFAFYTLFWGVVLAATVAWGLGTGNYRFVPAPAAALLAASAAIGLRSVLRTRQWRDLGPLVLLLAIYGVGRAAALVQGSARIRHTRYRDEKSGVAADVRHGKRKPAA